MTNNTQLQNSETTTDHVISADGTRIGYHSFGGGPGLVIVPGSMESAESHRQLGEALADMCTIYLPDRRGRGMSGPYGPDYSIRKEVEDLDAVLGQTGAHYVFGVSSSGLIALEAARTLPAVHKIALYEPALLMAGSTQTDWLPRYDQQLARGKLAAAMVTSMKGLELGGPVLGAMPSWLLTAFTKLAIRSEDKKAGPGDMTMRKFAPTLRYEALLLAEMTGALGSFRTVGADVLLLGGSKGLPFLKPSLKALEEVLPHVRRVEFAGLDHGGSGDVSKINAGGRPDVVAPELRSFFAQP
jgi:pimeloyl-ACP methyl ester carboxylesterase